MKRALPLLILFVSHTFAAGTNALSTLENSVSPLSNASGNSIPARDPSSLFTNPAWYYPHTFGRSLAFSYATGFSVDTANTIFGAYAFPLEKNKFIFGFAHRSIGGFTGYNTDGAETGSFAISDTVMALSHSYAVGNSLIVFETAKFYRTDFYTGDGYAFSSDAGILYTPVEQFSIGFSLDNLISTPILYYSEYEDFPVIAETMFSLNILNDKARFLYSLGYELPLYDDIPFELDHRYGLEILVWDPWADFQLGFNGSGFSFGIASVFSSYTLQLAYMPTDFEHRIATGITFDLDKVSEGPFSRPAHIPGTELEAELSDFYEGMEQYNNGEYKEAYATFSTILKENPNHKLAEQYRERALLHLQTLDWLDIEQEKLIRMHKELAIKYENQANYGEAIVEWRKIMEINPADPEADRNIERLKDLVNSRVLALHQQGLDKYSKNELIASIDHFSEALKLNPEYEPSRNWLFKIKQELSQDELKERERIERLQKAEVFYNRGLSYYGRKTFEEASSEFEQALIMNPEHENAAKYLAMAKEEWEAEKTGLRGIEAAKSFYAKGMKNYEEKLYFNSVRDFNMALKAYPAHEESQAMLPEAQKKLEQQVRPYLQKGKVEYQRKKFSSAEENYQAVLKLDPENAEAKEYLDKISAEKNAAVTFHMNEGRSAFRAASYSKAIFHLDEVVKLDPQNAEAKDLLDKARSQVKSTVDALHAEALADYNAGKYAPAISKWEKVLTIDAANALAQKYLTDAKGKQTQTKYGDLAKAYNAKGKKLYENRDYEQALSEFEKTLELVPNDPEALEYRDLCKVALSRQENQAEADQLFITGVRAYKQRNYEEAITKWNEAKKIDPDNAIIDRYIKLAIEAQKNRKVIDYMNGEKYYSEGKFLLALKSFERALQENPGNSKARSRLEDTKDRIAEQRDEYISLGDKEKRAGNYTEAAANYMSAYRLDNSAETLGKREDVILAQENYEKGLRYFNNENEVALAIAPFMKVLEINPFDKRASDYIGEAKKRGLKNVSIWKQQAAEAEKQKDFEKAYSLYTSIEQLEPGNTEIRQGLFRTKNELKKKAKIPYDEGKEAMALKNYKLALEKFAAAIAIVSDYEDAPELYKQARENNEKQKQVSSSGDSTASSGGGASHQAVVQEGIKLYRQGKYKEAIAVWQRVPKSSSDYSSAQKYIARAKLKL